jgi:hypothetical protein
VLDVELLENANGEDRPIVARRIVCERTLT